jgi:CRISPR/Cas system-associated exonuclease Cas4 (RecB family)
MTHVEPGCSVRRRNQHLSVSRLKLFEQCPAAYAFRYVQKVEQGDKAEAPEFGSLLHEVLEQLFDKVVREEHSGSLSEESALQIYRDLWASYRLDGLELYQQGATILREFVRRSPPVNHFSVLAVEQEFNIRIGEFLVNGFMDRVDKVDDETIRILDYKSNRILFSREEVDTDMQMSIYGIAAREIWPWAKNFEFAFHMLRHNSLIATRRTVEQLEDCADYVVALGRHSEEMVEFPARLNSNCCYCDYRNICSEYKRALAGKVEKLAYQQSDIASVALAREQAHKLAKLLYARKRELEDILRAQLEHEDELIVPEAKMKYRFLSVAKETKYPLEPTLALLVKYTGRTHEELTREVLKVDPKKLEAQIEKMKATGSSRAKVLEVELEHVAVKVMEPRFDAQAFKGDVKPKPLRPIAERVIGSDR